MSYTRGAGIALQTGLVAAGGGYTPPTTLLGLDFTEDLQIHRIINGEFPAYLRNIEWLTFGKRVLDNSATFKWDFDLDSYQAGFAPYNLYGAPTVSGTYTKTFSDRNGATRKALYLAKVNETTEWDDIADAWIAQLKISGDPRGRVKCSATGIGLLRPIQTGAKPTLTRITPPDRSPFGGWQNVVSRAGSAECFDSWTLTLNNKVTPGWCPPVTNPPLGTPEGATPGRWKFAGLTGDIAGLIGNYLAYSGSALAHFLTNVGDSFGTVAQDNETTGLGYIPSAILAAAEVDWEDVDIKDAASPRDLDVKGMLSDKTATGYALQMAFINGYTYTPA